MDLVLFGMQGSGKGTQSRLIVEQFDFEIFETGAELRRLAQDDSELGQKVKSIIEAGHLVPSEVVMEIIEAFLDNLPEGTAALFDGIPRSSDQQELFDALMERKGRDFKGILIELTEEEALKRLTTRRICAGCKAAYPSTYEADACEKCGSELVTRKDDTPDAIRVRLDTFQEKTLPVIESYKERGLMLSIDGQQSIDACTVDIMELLKSHF